MYYAMYIKLYIVIVVYNIIVNKNIRLAVKKQKTIPHLAQFICHLWICCNHPNQVLINIFSVFLSQY